MKNKFFVTLCSSLLFLLWTLDAWARAGGAGGGGGHSRGGGGYSGGSSGFSGGGGGGGDLFFIYYLLGTPWGWGLILIAVLFIMLRYRNQESKFNLDLSNTPLASKSVEIPLPPAEILDLENKTQSAFLTIQTSWSEKKTSSMRRFITDGVYQRFHAQFTMMNLLDQTNTISDVCVLGIRPTKYSLEGDYECVDLEIRAEANDRFVSPRFPEFNSPGGQERFTEYWSFIRRKDCQKDKNIFHTNQCPKCSGALTEKLMETARCPYCGVYINSGEFDWVLSEITQQEDYRFNGSEKGALDLTNQIQSLRLRNPHFSTQVLEDKASNAFLQLLIGFASKNLQTVQRFSTAQFLSKAQQIADKQDYIYDRLYLRSVNLLDLSFPSADGVQARIEIGCAFHRVQLVGNKAMMLDPEILPSTFVLTMVHQLSAQPPQGSIYANACPSCGGSQKDSLNPTCEYCGSVLNDPKGDWIVDNLRFET